MSTPILPTDKAERKTYPITRGCLDYFPLALAYVSHVSFKANEQHNPGEEMHWARGKSMDHADCIPRHLIERGMEDDDGLLHTGKLAWRALALLQEELEEAGFGRPGQASVFPAHMSPQEIVDVAQEFVSEELPGLMGLVKATSSPSVHGLTGGRHDVGYR